jgi:hypothetical protein
MTTREYNLTGFTRITVRHAIELEVVRSDSYKISVSGSDSAINNIDVFLEGDTLVLGYKLNLVSFFTLPFSRTIITVAMPELRELNINGATRGTISGFDNAGDFTLYVSGASRLDINNVSVNNMKWDMSGASRIVGQIKVATNFDVRLTGASRVDLKGSAQDISVDASGASYLSLKDFPVGNAKLRLMGASYSGINVNGKLDVSLDGASRLEYDGHPVLGDIKIAGASNFKRKARD